MAKLKLEKEWRLWAAVGALALVVLIWLYFVSRPPTEGGEYLWKVVQVVDDKTLLLKGSGSSVKFKLIGLKIPPAHAAAAKDYLKKTLENNWVRMKPLKEGKDGEKEGFIYFSGDDIVGRMVRQGLAEVDNSETAFDVRPFMELEQEAKRENKGLWRQSESGVK
jgi:endonuclease YncB( thermonuclease family)